MKFNVRNSVPTSWTTNDSLRSDEEATQQRNDLDYCAIIKFYNKLEQEEDENQRDCIMIMLKDLKGLLKYLNSLPGCSKFTATNPKLFGINFKSKCMNPEFVYKYSEYFCNGTYEISLLDFVPYKNILFKCTVQCLENMPSIFNETIIIEGLDFHEEFAFKTLEEQRKQLLDDSSAKNNNINVSRLDRNNIKTISLKLVEELKKGSKNNFSVFEVFFVKDKHTNKYVLIDVIQRLPFKKIETYQINDGRGQRGGAHSKYLMDSNRSKTSIKNTQK